MKIRNGFISNSSSSSFTCQICHETWSGWDGEYGDTRQMGCENGHSFCNGCVNEHLNVEKLRDQILEQLDPEDQAEFGKDLETLQEFIDDNWGDIEGFLLEHDMDWELPAHFCPVCRFEILTDYDALRWLLWQHEITKEEILEEIKARFIDYKYFTKYLKDMGL
jgi:hypothetical protein